MSTLPGMRRLADWLDVSDVPAPHGIHAAYPAADEAWIRRLAAAASTAARVGLRPKLTVGPTRSLGGHQGVGVRLSWFDPQGGQISRPQAAAALRMLVALAGVGEMPPPASVDVMCALREVGQPARAVVAEVALQLGEQRIVGDGQVCVTHQLARGVSYTVHGFLW